MPQSDRIPRARHDAFGLDFQALKQDGIALSQDLSGAIWTDYNAHDPGVTLLEQLCYGLTELAYRSGFEMQDYLADANGQIDFERLALFRPHAIFSSQPVTVDDYCKLLFAAIADIDDVRFTPQPGGLYRVSVKLYRAAGGEEPEPQQKEAVKQRIASVFAAHRSLGEDLDAIDIVDTYPCFLKGDIEIHGTRSPAEIYAEIFFKCARRISSDIRIDRYEDVLAAGATLEELFDGPLIPQGYISDRDFQKTRSTPTLAELVMLIGRIDGVKQVRRLDLVDAEGQSIRGDFSCEVSERGLPCLSYPERPEHRRLLNLVYGPAGVPAAGVPGSVTPESNASASAASEKERLMLEAARLHVQKLEFEYRAFRNNDNALGNFIKLPRGRYRQLAGYYSIQNQFPRIYGINREGVPGSASTEIKAKAKQLKAYLFPFEQLMANYLQGLHQLPRLFSLDDTLQRSYFSQYLDDARLPGIEALYADPGGAALMAEIQARYDNFVDRRNRVLDVLLALFGETFQQDALLRFNYYRPDDAGRWAIENKIRFLRNLIEISGQRAAARPVGHPGSAGGWQKRVGILLGIEHFEAPRSVCAGFEHKRIELIDDRAYHTLAQERSLPPDTAGLTTVAVLDPAELDAGAALHLKQCTISEAMLRRGVDIGRYKLRQSAGGVTLYFQERADTPLYRLAQLPSTRDAAVSAHRLRAALVRLNQDSEGLHVIEHILLRPPSDQASDDPAFDDYAFRLSIVFPAWSARFADREFRRFAEETVCRQLPAHLYPEFHWLEFEAMRRFESLHRAWLDPERSPTAARDLLAFLREQPTPAAPAYWV